MLSSCLTCATWRLPSEEAVSSCPLFVRKAASGFWGVQGDSSRKIKHQPTSQAANACHAPLGPMTNARRLPHRNNPMPPQSEIRWMPRSVSRS